MSEITLSKTFAEAPNKEVLYGADLNDNFEGIVTGSNDNHTRLTTVEGLYVKKNGTVNLTALLSVTNATSLSIDITDVANKDKIPTCYDVDAALDALLSPFKEYGLTLSHSGGNIAVAVGQRWDSTYAEKLAYAGGTLTVGSLASATPGTRYYIFMGKNVGGTVVLEKDTNANGSGLSAITGTKVCIGEFYAIAASTSIDTTILVTYHPDGTKTYVYTQASGNFPGADVTITHNLGTQNILVIPMAIKDSDGDLFSLQGNNGSYAYDPVHIDSTNVVILEFETTFIAAGTSGAVNITNSADYSLKVIIKTLGV